MQPFALRSFQRQTCWHLLILLNVSSLHHGNSTTSGSLGIECLQPSLDFSGKLFFSFSCSSSSSSIRISGRTCQWSTQTFDSGGAILDGGSLAAHHSQHVGRHYSVVSHGTRSHHGCFSRLGTQGSAVSAFNPLAAVMCVTETGVLFLSLSGSGGATQAFTSKV